MPRRITQRNHSPERRQPCKMIRPAYSMPRDEREAARPAPVTKVWPVTSHNVREELMRPGHELARTSWLPDKL